MTSIKVKFRPSAKPENEGTIYYQIIHLRVVRQMLSPHRILSTEWNDRRSAVSDTTDPSRQKHLNEVRRNIWLDTARLQRIIAWFERKGLSYTADHIVAEYFRRLQKCSLTNFMQSLIAGFRKSGQFRTAETYSTTLNSFKNFLSSRNSGCDIMLDAIDAPLMEEYQTWHRLKGNVPNTISFYARILRAVYNRAVEDELIPDNHPFRHIYTGVAATDKRAITIKALKRIRHLNLASLPKLDYARDIFMLSFMLRGMSFVDMAYLRKSDLKDGRITYIRRKTNQRLTIEWTTEMQHILDKYPANPTDYLLPILQRKGINERFAIHNLNHTINSSLKIIGKSVGINIPLTLYVARHSWASAALTKGIPIGIISEGMGHTSERTTRIYLAGIDTSPIDKANAILLRSIE